MTWTWISGWVRDFSGSEAQMTAEYRSILRHYGPDWDGWEELNRAIEKRWSKAALLRIKKAVWA